MVGTGRGQGGAGGARGVRVVAASAVALVLVVSVIGCTKDKAGASVTLESAGQAGANPFTSSVAVGDVVEFPSEVTAVGAEARLGMARDEASGTLTTLGTEPGLYGGSSDAAVCDPAQLVTYLAENEDKASAWASVFDIEPERIPDFVAGLTPIVLISDTVVTNHGYRDGDATSLQSVLQAGTAVMVDALGVPRVKCNCGNPLGPPAPDPLSEADPIGDAWPGYEPDEVVLVHPGERVDSLTVVDVETAEPIEVAPPSAGPVSTPGDVDDTVVRDETALPCRGYDHLEDALAGVVEATAHPSTIDPNWVALVAPNYPGAGGSTQVMHCDGRTWEGIYFLSSAPCLVLKSGVDAPAAVKDELGITC